MQSGLPESFQNPGVKRYDPAAYPGFAKGEPKGGPWRARRARAYNRGLGVEPPSTECRGQGQAPGGATGELPEAQSFLPIFIQTKGQKLRS